MEDFFSHLVLDIKMGLETSIKGSEIVFDYLHFIYYIVNVKSRWIIHRFSQLDKKKKRNNKSHQYKKINAFNTL